MTKISYAPTFSGDRPLRWLALRVALGLAAAFLADRLFLDCAAPGVSIVIFLAALGSASLAVNPDRATHPEAVVAVIVFICGLVANFEDVSLLSIFVGMTATATFALAMAEGGALRLSATAPRAAAWPLLGVFRFLGDILRVRRLMRGADSRIVAIGSVRGWIVPILALGIFGMLLAAANPVLTLWFSQVWATVLELAFSGHAPFWAFIFILVWPLLHIRRRRYREAAIRMAAPTPKASVLLGETAVVRSLVLLNALFALQNVVDFAYLWAGLSLPAGMTYAAYAHRGAYLLILTALLAAGFVLVAMREGGPADASRLIRPLVFCWIGQNVLLVVSSGLRLDLYVASYSLTELRLAAFIWMALVAVGLALIALQILRRESNAWLLEMNARALAAALIGACLLNFSAVVAEYNVAHSLEARGVGPALDIYYLASLGPQSIPALDAFAQISPSQRQRSMELRTALAAQLPEDWRSWTFRAWRLRRYLAINPPIAISSDSFVSPRQNEVGP